MSNVNTYVNRNYVAYVVHSHERRPGISRVSPPVSVESQGCQFDPTFLYLLFSFFCLVLLRAKDEINVPIALSPFRDKILLLFLSYPFMPLAHSLDLFFPKPKHRLFCVALATVFLSG